MNRRHPLLVNPKWFLFLILILFSQIGFALPFNITTKAGTALPTIVPAGGAATAYYTVQNNTGSTRVNNYVKYLPPNVFQVLSGGTFPNTCASLFTLAPRGAPGDSCTLQLTITGPVFAGDPDPHHHLFVCFPGGTTCAGPLNLLNVSLLQSITIIPANPSVTQGQSLQFTAIGHFADGSTQNLTSLVTWTSSNTNVATINSGGVATATTSLSGGVTTITATFGTVSGSTTLTVKTLTSINVVPVNPIVPQSQSLQFNAIGTFSDGSTQNITPLVAWSSSNPSVATINASGLAVATSNLAGGTTNITASIGSISGFTILTVPTLQSITVTPANPTLAQGQTLQFNAIGNFSDGSTRNLTSSVSLWTSSNINVATIVPNGTNGGLATATTNLAGGMTTITANIGALSGSTTLTVPSLTSITVTPANQTITPGSTVQYTATGTFTDGSTQNITTNPGTTWSSSNTNIATINSSGLATATYLGGGPIVIRASNGLISGTTNLTVAPVLQSITVTPANQNILVGGTLQFTATGNYSDSSTRNLTTNVTWSASGTAATISTSGLATGVTVGSSTITATLFTVSGSTTLNVSAMMLIAVGQDLTNLQPPLIVQSTDGGTTWSESPTIGGGPPTGGFFSGACTGIGAPAFCIAGGKTTGVSPTPPLLVQTVNGGTAWNAVTGLSITTNGTFNSTACTGNTICIAGGEDDNTTPGTAALLVQSTNGGTSWAVSSTGLNGAYYFKGTSCTGSGASAICIATGYQNVSPQVPFLVQTINSGSSWTQPPVFGLGANGQLLGASCSGGNGTSTICVAGGVNTLGPPILVQGTNPGGGLTWSAVPVSPSLPAQGTFQSSSCTGSVGSTPNATCVAAGQQGSPLSPAPLLAQTLDGGSTWNIVNFSISQGEFFATSCTGTSSTVCIATGLQGSALTPTPLIAVSKNGGTWNVFTSFPSITQGLFTAASCTGNGATAVCVAAGWQGSIIPSSTTPPLLVVSTDGGTSWTVQTLSAPQFGLFLGAGSSGGASLVPKKKFGAETILKDILSENSFSMYNMNV